MESFPSPREVVLPLDEADLNEILESGNKSMSQLVEQNVLITGASGFVGSWFSEAWRHAHEILGGDGKLILVNRKITARQRSLFDNLPMIELVEADVRDFHTIPKDLDLVVHAATSASQNLNTSNPREMESVIEAGILAVSEICSSNKCRLLNLSSGAVYGLARNGEECFPESRELERDHFIDGSQYHQSKIRAEEFLRRQKKSFGLDYVNARLFAFIGPLLPIDSHFAAGNFIRDSVAGRTIQVHGDGSSVRSYMYGADLVKWLISIAVSGLSGESYNVGSPESLTIRELALMVSSHGGVGAVFGNEETYGNPRYVPCTEKCRSELGLQIEVGLEESIQRTTAWWTKAIRSI